MTRIAIVYHSVTGATCRLAQAVVDGVRAAGARPEVLQILGDDIIAGRFQNAGFLQTIDQVEAVVFGAPTFMGGPSAQFKAFADASSDRWERQAWQGKLAAGFTSGSNYNGDQTSTLQYFAVLAAQHGMLWLGVDIPGGCDVANRNRLGVQLGAAARTTETEVDGSDLATAEHLGMRIAGFAMRLADAHD